MDNGYMGLLQLVLSGVTTHLGGSQGHWGGKEGTEMWFLGDFSEVDLGGYLVISVYLHELGPEQMALMPAALQVSATWRSRWEKRKKDDRGKGRRKKDRTKGVGKKQN